MSLADILGTKFIDAAGVIVPMLLFYAVGKYGTFRRIRKVRGGIIYRSGEDERREWLGLIGVISMAIGAYFLSTALLGLPFT